MELTDPTLFWLVVAGAGLLPLITVALWARGKPAGSLARRIGRAACGLVMVALCQGLAVTALFLSVNNQYGFYNSWSDLFGQEAARPEPVQTGGLASGSGRIQLVTVHGQASGVSGQVLMWLPPQYQDPSYASAKFPVMMFLPGQPSSPHHVFAEYDFGNAASAAIRAGQIKPFVAVFPPIMINPPRDTECTDVPNGPQAEKWLVDDVTAAVTAQFRVESLGKKWSVVGWSTGGLCAAKLLFRHPQLFASGVSIGGDYMAYLDNTTGDLFGGSQQLRNENSPQWLYQSHHGTQGTKLLMVTGQQDLSSWASTAAMAAVTKGDPNVALIAFAHGGHNFKNYTAQLPAVFRWLQGTGAFG